MIYLYGYREIKHLNDERRSRALLEYQRRQVVPQPAVKTDDVIEADVIELMFGTHCEPDQIGA